MKYLDLFSGYGGFALGIQQSNTYQPECIGFSEIDKYAIQVYKKHFPNHKNYGDIIKIKPKELPDFDLLTGGFPCQAFSIAGKRKGFNDTRGTLFFDIARIIKEKSPKYILLENVKGLLSHDFGETFRTILATLTELRYDLQWQVLNAKNFGVPQNRERVFIVGHLRGEPRPEVFPIRETDKKDTRNTGEDLSYCLDASYYKGTNTLEKGRRQLIQLNKPKHSNDRVYSEKGISPTLNTMQGGRRQPFIALSLTTNIKKIQQDDGIYNGAKIRRLTPLECERLMGLPDNWTKEGIEGKISDTQRYKLCGNGVCVPVVKFIIKELLI